MAAKNDCKFEKTNQEITMPISDERCYARRRASLCSTRNHMLLSFGSSQQVVPLSGVLPATTQVQTLVLQVSAGGEN